MQEDSKEKAGEEFKSSIRPHNKRAAPDTQVDSAGHPAKKKDKGCRAWIYVLNNYTPLQEVNIGGIKCVYNVFGEEVAPTTGTKHLQGFICFSDAKTMSAVKKVMGVDSIHLEPKSPFSTFLEARNYCMKGKSEDYKGKSLDWKGEGWIGYEVGVLPKDQMAKGEMGKAHYAEILQGLESGHSIPQLIKSGVMDLGEVINIEKNWKRLNELKKNEKALLRSPLPPVLSNDWELRMPATPQEKKCHYWIYSKGCNMGKTAFCSYLKTFKAYGWNYNEAYQSTIQEDAQCIIMDAFHGQVKICDMEALCDGTYHFTAKNVNDWTLDVKPIVVVCSNMSPAQVFHQAKDEQIAVLLARFNVIELNLMADLDIQHQQLLKRTDGKKAVGKYI